MFLCESFLSPPNSNHLPTPVIREVERSGVGSWGGGGGGDLSGCDPQDPPGSGPVGHGANGMMHEGGMHSMAVVSCAAVLMTYIYIYNIVTKSH